MYYFYLHSTSFNNIHVSLLLSTSSIRLPLIINLDNAFVCTLDNGLRSIVVVVGLLMGCIAPYIINGRNNNDRSTHLPKCCSGVVITFPSDVFKDLSYTESLLDELNSSTPPQLRSNDEEEEEDDEEEDAMEEDAMEEDNKGLDKVDFALCSICTISVSFICNISNTWSPSICKVA